LSRFKKYHSSENLNFIYLGIFQNFKLRILMEKNPSKISQAKFYFKHFELLWAKLLGLST